MGAPDSGTVRKRAMELAQIAGHSVFTEADWRQAKRELHGGLNGASEEDGEPLPEAYSTQDMVVIDSGHHVENIPVEDASNIVEELIAEGMDEAVHEQMLEASKLDLQEGEPEK